ncbi:NINE protein [Oscillatoria sp. CS-180]|uniref:NINE protein n=1 Tax=Oscillatoria sp. CS-180 TaxID=3021720 RepID=UPI00232B5D76|nr:NINE protein [Oscillatoria sp. CS-180]MDB9528164.1 NINE protein [Oscillatoria sp. CS-180]
MPSSGSSDRLALSYLLWAGCFFGVSGLHRLYNGKIATGIIWLFTFGLFGIGQFVDVFFVPGMARDHQLRRLKAHYGDGIYDVVGQPAVATQTVQKPTRQEKRMKLLQAAKNNSGYLSVTQAVLDTGLDFDEVEVLLSDMAKSGYVGVDNHPETGVVIYRFDELRS